MLDLIRAIRDSGKAAIMLSSHLLRDVDECCDEALVLNHGKVARYCDLAAERRANRRFLDIEVQGNRELFAGELERLGMEFALDGQRRLKVVLPEHMEMSRFFEIAAEQDLQIRRLHSKRDSLEDIFLEAVGEI